MRSAFHVREYELYKLSLVRSQYHVQAVIAFDADGVSCLVPQLRKPLDVILSHDWPDVTSYGDVEKLCAGHPHWKYAAPMLLLDMPEL